MAAETFTRELRVSATPERCWEVLTDVAQLSSWVSIVHDAEELERLARYRAVLQDQVGPIKLRAKLDIGVEVPEQGKHVRIQATGRDAHVNSQIAVDAEMRLEPLGEGTLVAVSGRYQVTGRVAAMGGGIIRKKADTILREFFDQAGRTLGALDGAEASSPASG